MGYFKKTKQIKDQEFGSSKDISSHRFSPWWLYIEKKILEIVVKNQPVIEHKPHNGANEIHREAKVTRKRNFISFPNGQ